ncbi:MAG: hypothetical protein ACW980_24715 [Promethearchaeota archaeon]|jgi:hypothetical protein
MKKYIFLILLVLTATSTSTSTSQQFIHEPLVEILDLDVDGSTAVFVNISKGFDFVKRIIWNLDFATNAFETGKFADDTALTNGINIYYNDVSILDDDNITNNAKFSHTSYDIAIITSDKNPKERLLVSRWSFDKFTPEGLKINSDRTLAFHIQDNISALASVDVFQVTIEGYSKTVDSYFNLANDYFYPNVINVIQLRYLTVGQNYNLLVNTTNDLHYWINTTAQEENIQIYFSQETATDTNVINLKLYQGDTLKETKTWIVEPQGYNPLGTVINGIGIMIILGIFGLAFLGLFTKKGRR